MTTQLETFFKDQGLRPIGTLAHWGIKGMRWGIRRSDAELARAGGGEAADAVRAKETLRAIQSAGSLSAASDSDLNHLISRLNTEKRYSDIQQSTFQKGHTKVKTLLNTGQTINDVIKFTQSPAGQIVATHFGFNNPIGKHRKK